MTYMYMFNNWIAITNSQGVDYEQYGSKQFYNPPTSYGNTILIELF